MDSGMLTNIPEWAASMASRSTNQVPEMVQKPGPQFWKILEFVRSIGWKSIPFTVAPRPRRVPELAGTPESTPVPTGTVLRLPFTSCTAVGGWPLSTTRPTADLTAVTFPGDQTASAPAETGWKAMSPSNASDATV